MADAYMELIGRLLRLLGEVDSVYTVEALIMPVLKHICKRVGVSNEEYDEDENAILTIMCDDRVYEARLAMNVTTSVRFREIWRAPDTYAYLFDEDEEE
jgi:hypothetical protein